MSVPIVRIKDETVTFRMGPPGGFRILGALTGLAFFLGHDVTISCGSDSHPAADHHSTGEAFDVRTIGLDDETIKRMLLWLRQDLGPLFTVLHERPVDVESGPLAGLVTVNPHASGQHIHCQVKLGTVYPPA